MGLADTIRIALGRLTPAEQEERDEAARRRMLANRQREAAEAPRHRRRSHKELMEVAAGIASMDLVCHADTLHRINSFMEHDHWHRPTEQNGRLTALPDMMVKVHLSGPGVAAVLFRMNLASTYGNPRDRAAARRYYDAFASIVDQVDLDAPSSAEIPPVVLDARPGRPAPVDEEHGQPDQA